MDAKKYRQEIAELQAARAEDLAALREQVQSELQCPVVLWLGCCEMCGSVGLLVSWPEMKCLRYLSRFVSWCFLPACY